MVDAAVRWAPALALALLVALGSASSEQPLPLAVGGAVLAVAAVVVGGRATSWPLFAALGASAVGVAVVASGSAANIGWFGMCVLAGWSALRAGVRPTLLLTPALAVVFVVEWARNTDGGWFTWLAGLLFTVVVCLMARRQGELIDRLRAAQADLAERAATEERTRIARELHDVIGHALTVSLLHITSARLALHEDLEEAEEALVEAERLGQQSLAEVRHAVGMLRDASSDGRSPLPDATRIEELVEGFRRTGSPLTWELSGDPAAMAATSGLTVYRILQEALTNAARHAPGVRTTARLVIGEVRTELVVDSADVRARAASPGAGMAGMRERAEAVGGTLNAGPFEDGWRVRAVVPT